MPLAQMEKPQSSLTTSFGSILLEGPLTYRGLPSSGGHEHVNNNIVYYAHSKCIAWH